ncbi:MAG TPA: sigma-70 family RNA polymerase sigma factor [Acidimicrobiia bacterium]
MSKKSDGVQSSVSQERFDRLFDDYHQAVYRYCVRRLGRVDAEDATAEVFAVAWRKIDDLPDDEATRAWLFGVAYRVVGNQFRSSRRRTGLSRRIAMERIEESRQTVDSNPMADLLLEALSSLGYDDAEILRLSVWDGLSRAEIARVLKMKENAVDQRLHRARVRLRSKFESLAPTIEPEEASA